MLGSWLMKAYDIGSQVVGGVTQPNLPIPDRDIFDWPKNWRYYDEEMERWYGAWNQLGARKEEEENKNPN